MARSEVVAARAVIVKEMRLAVALTTCGVRIPVASLANLEQRFEALERKVGLVCQPTFAERAEREWLRAKN